ncbi:hypothetical protein [Kitasatospora sp. MBT63]|uniref:hypothetical protein n=1 Tax=Kitasatospora sp. MBT63 TaxID=1444768 RepID=UPI000A9103B1|nr:hypothetical protein [Kitasatospora sp. MBT63]
MTTPEEHTPQPDDKSRERSAEERNVVAPTPAEVRAKARDGDEDEEAEAPAADTRAP